MATAQNNTNMQTKSFFVETVIVGGGFCGVNLALRLQELNKDHLVVEQNRLFHAWTHCRWDAFQLNTPHFCNRLHGQGDGMSDTSVGREFAQELQLWQAHVQHSKLQTRERCRVESVTAASAMAAAKHPRARFAVTLRETSAEEGATDERKEDPPPPSSLIHCRNVVCCTGENAIPNLPTELSRKLQEHDIVQMHSRDFKGLHQFPDDDDDDKYIVLVGSGQSGAQIAEHLQGGGAKVLLATGRAGGIFRSYRGEDLFVWLQRAGLLQLPDAVRQQLPQGEQMRYSRNPLVGPSHALSLFSLARQGVTVTGRLQDLVEDNKLVFARDRCHNAQATLDGYNKVADLIQDWIAKQPPEVTADFADETPETRLPEPEWVPEPALLKDEGLTELPLDQVRGVVWCTGYRSSVQRYLQDDVMAPGDFNGRTQSPDVLVSRSVPGLFYAGFPWLHTSSSSIFCGFDWDHSELLKHLFGSDEDVAAGAAGTTAADA